MHVGDITVSLVTVSLFGNHAGDVMVIHLNTSHFFIGNHLSTGIFDYVCQGIRQLLASSDELKGAFGVQHGEQCVEVGWSHAFHATEQRTQVGQQGFQFRVGEVTVDEFIVRPGEVVADLGHAVRLRLAQIEQVFFLGEFIEPVVIGPDPLFLFRK